ncbi:fumarate hydratase [Thermococcus sp.]
MSEEFVDSIVEAIRLAVTKIPEDTFSAIRKAYAGEEDEIARFNLENILKAREVGKADAIPVCQDTGTLTSGGNNRGDEARDEGSPAQAQRGGRSHGQNSGNNTGKGIPVIHWEPVLGMG